MSRKNPSAQQHHHNNGTCATVTADTVSRNGQDGRDEKGRFTKGNKGGPGNPFAGSVAKLRKAALAVISEDDMQSVFRVLLLRAQGGHLPAMKLLFAYTIGLPAQTVDPDEVLEMQEEIAEVLPKAEPGEPGSVAQEFIDGLQGTLHAAGIDETLRQHLDGKLRSFFQVEHEQHANVVRCAPLHDKTAEPTPMRAKGTSASAPPEHQQIDESEETAGTQFPRVQEKTDTTDLSGEAASTDEALTTAQRQTGDSSAVRHRSNKRSKGVAAPADVAAKVSGHRPHSATVNKPGFTQSDEADASRQGSMPQQSRRAFPDTRAANSNPS
jgi:hypothetical protein